MAYALAAIVLLALLAGVGWYLYGQTLKLCGELLTENKILRMGAEARDRMDARLAGPVATGGKLRARLLARARRHELSAATPDEAAAAPAKPNG